MLASALTIAIAALNVNTPTGVSTTVFDDPSMQFGAVYEANELCQLGLTPSDFHEYEIEIQAYDEAKILLGAHLTILRWKRWSSGERDRFCDLLKHFEFPRRRR
jgi:hypothetical protein